jgi:hypothetical protein
MPRSTGRYRPTWKHTIAYSELYIYILYILTSVIRESCDGQCAEFPTFGN